MDVCLTTLQELLDADLRSAGWDGYDLSTHVRNFHPRTPYRAAQPCQLLLANPYPGLLNSEAQGAMASLSSALLKKFHNDETDAVRDSRATALFLEANEKCRTFAFRADVQDEVKLVLGGVECLFDSFFHPSPETHLKSFTRSVRDFHRNRIRSRPLDSDLLLNLSSVSEGFRVGPGASIGAAETDLYSKVVLSGMESYDPLLHKLFVHAISADERWSSLEAWRALRFGYKTVPGSKIAFAPKRRDISRTICSEAILAMMFQLGIGKVLERGLTAMFEIDLSDQQDWNRHLAWLGSHTGDFGTMDLRSASDLNSTTMLKRFIPTDQFSWFARTRAPSTVFPDGTRVDLHMLSSMGNGYTFPLQTLLFASVVKASYHVLGIDCRFRGKSPTAAVFGDDIVCRKEAYGLIAETLSILGHEVNTEKSFNTGFFRESCGQDFINGCNVRGVYIQRLKTDGDMYSAINRLNRWSALHGIILRRSVGYLQQRCRSNLVPMYESDDAGIKVPSVYAKERDANGAFRYTALCVVPDSVRIPDAQCDDDGNFVQPLIPAHTIKRMKRFEYNADGLLFVTLAGALRSGKLGLRSKKPRTVLRRRVTPCWDHVSPADRLRGLSPDGDWEVVFGLNLFS